MQGCAGSGKTMILLHRLANMKFNEKKYDFSRVKIITPNDNFNLFIDGLAENLGISGITKTTLSGYYASLLGRYHADIAKGATHKGKEREKYEKSLIADESELPLETREFIYSEKFRIDISTQVKQFITEDSGKHREIAEVVGSLPSDNQNNKNEGSKKKRTSIIESLLKRENLDIDYKKNYVCILYLKTMIMYYYFGSLHGFNDTLLCIDEAQDIAPTQFELLKNINGKNLKFNIYGDLNQQVEDGVNIGDWSKIKDICGSTEIFTLNENYRNSENIVDFYNSDLGFSDISFGLRSRDVTKISENEIQSIIELCLAKDNRIAVICLHKQILGQFANTNTEMGKVKAGKISLMTVKEVKGLEFDVVIVFPDGMSRNEKYIAYTRALNDLFIVD